MEKNGQEVLCEECGRLEALEKFGIQICLFKGCISPQTKVNGCKYFEEKMPNGIPIRWLPISARKIDD